MRNPINRTTVQVGTNKFETVEKSGPINYKKSDGTFDTIDHTFNDTTSSIGNISLMDKGIMSVGKRKGNNPTKVVGIRPDKNQHLGTQQLEFSLVNVELDSASQSFDVETDLEIVLGPAQVSQLVKANKDFKDFKVEFDIHNTGLELQNSKYSNTTTIREDFGFNLTNLGEINTTTTDSTLGGLFTQSRATPYIECNISQITNNYITTGQYSNTEEFGSSDLSNYHIDENVYPNGGAAYLKDCIVLIAKMHNIEESIEDIFVNQMCNEYGLEIIWEGGVNGQYFTKNGKKVASYYSIDNQFYMFINTKAIPDDVKTLFQRKTFNDTSFLDITLSDFNTTITNMFNVDLTIELNTDYYEPINDNFVFKVNKESFYINLPILFDESYNQLDLGTTHSLKQNNDGSYRYTKYFSLNGYLKNSHNVKYIDATLAAGGTSKVIQYNFPSSATATTSTNRRTSANMTTARNASTGTSVTTHGTAVVEMAGTDQTVGSNNGAATFSWKNFNCAIQQFDTSGITGTVDSLELRMYGGYRIAASGWDSTTDISLIMLKGNSGLDGTTADWNDFQGHRSSWSDSTAVEYSGEHIASGSSVLTGNYIALNSDCKTDVQDEDEVQIIPVEYDEWYLNDFNSSVPTDETAERTFRGYGSGASSAGFRPTLIYEVAAAAGFGHKTIGVAAASIGKVNGVATANIGKVIGID